MIGDRVAEFLERFPADVEPWHPHFTIHGDPFVVTNLTRPAFTRVAEVCTAPDDYGQANAHLLAAAPALLKAVLLVLSCHTERVEGGHSGHPPRHTGRCDECAQEWPCGTYKLIAEGLGTPVV